MKVLKTVQYMFYVHARNISLSNISHKTVPTNLKGKSKSSQEWLTRQLNDEYVKRSRYHGYRCRSAFKLLEIDEKYKILKPGDAVVDCGAAPGSWTQVVVNKLKLDKETADGKPRKGVAIAVDLQHIESIKGAIVIPESDFTQLEVQEKIKSFLPSGQANTILSDMAPKASGTPELDSAALMRLVYSALKFSYMVLKNNGTFVCKVWDGQDVDKFYQTLQNLFTNVKRCKPKASRSDSSELYLIATGFKRPENKI
ncbi:rRNA methyltransferase 2, mitochondrial-like [Argiope bruennichi]|uniref:rRNA methyltransferase 2, mitochondrial-like n=1 Tax=Argiope bruennichi TaxID=94029 RepID=UPI0024958722|nr:rRNA methyltransferase 2, mitochondrial-like [Argiope bruennichi]